jgi:hypothetical protein
MMRMWDMMEAVLAAGATERQCRCARARRRDGGSPSGGGTGGVQGTRRGKRGIGGLKSEGGATWRIGEGPITILVASIAYIYEYTWDFLII